MIELETLGISQPSAPLLDLDDVFEAIEQPAPRALVDLLKRVGDQPIAERLFVALAPRLISVKLIHHRGTADLNRLGDRDPVFPGAALARHRLLAEADGF